MTDDVRALGLAAAAVGGALLPARASVWGSVGALVALGLLRWRWLRWLAVALLASGLAQRSLDGLDGLEPGLVVAEVTLLGDPTPAPGGVRVDVRWGGRRLEARARGVSADALRPRLAGEVVALRGTVSLVGADRPWLVPRHVAGELRVLRVDGWQPGDPMSRLANGLRRTLGAGAAPLGARAASLYTGLVIGDDRAQPADLADAFRGAGLTHLLAVSGQNVAFALAVAGPLLRRLRIWPRLLATVAVIGLFGLLTRFEPSVLRASAMAALAATVAVAGMPTSRLRTIGWALTGLVLVDPLLVRSVGFRLSAGAALAIVLLAPRLSPVLPGPAALRDALAVTLAAQLGVAPVLLATFGPIPVASLPANLLCVPVAGVVMVWGLTAGLVAGALGGDAAAVLHGPTRLALGWLDLVARRAAAAPLGELGAGHLIALAAGLGLLGAGSRAVVRRGGASLAAGAVLMAVVTAHAPVPLRQALEVGVVRWHAPDADVVVLGGAGGRAPLSPATVLEALRRSGVGTIDLLVVADPSVPAAAVDAVRRTHRVGATRSSADGSATVTVGGLVVRIVAVPGRVVVDAVPRGP